MFVHLFRIYQIVWRYHPKSIIYKPFFSVYFILVVVNKPSKSIFCFFFHLLTVSDGLKGPYLYALYNSYHISHKTIEFLFVTANISSLCIGTFVASLADKLYEQLFRLKISVKIWLYLVVDDVRLFYVHFYLV